jgi:16S rRNA (guanine966-N2)-methyltransferase
MRVGAGKWKNARLPAAGRDIRPVPGRLRTSLFSVLADRVPGARVLDLCAGIGGLGIEAVSRGAASAVLVDRDPRAVSAITRWAREHGAGDEVVARVGDARAGRFPPGPYDLVFLDPPFSAWEDGSGASFLERAVEAVADGGRVVAKTGAKTAVPEDPRWAVVDRRVQGSVAYVLLRRAGDGGAGSPGTDQGG